MDNKFVITNSMRNQTACINKLQNLYLYKLKPRWYGASRALVIGSAVHDAVEIMYRTLYNALAGDAPLHAALEAGLGYFDGSLTHYIAYNDLHKNQSPEDLKYDMDYDRMLVEVQIHVYYYEIYLKEKFEIAVLDKELGLEKSMMARTITPGGRKSPKYYYAGKNDQLFYLPADGKHYLSELKTKSKMFWTATHKLGMKYDEQITGYLWLFRQNYPNMKINDVIYTVLLKPVAPRYVMRKAEDQAEFQQRILDTRYDMLEKTRAKVMDDLADHVDRILIHRADGQIDSFGKRAYRESLKIEQMLKDEGYINPGYGGENCVKFNKPCEFFDLCAEHSRPKDLSVDYVIKSNAHEELGMEVSE